jgi:hypothetical protein
VGQRRSDDREFYTVTNIRNTTFYSTPKTFNTFLFVCFVFFCAWCELFPRFIWLPTRRVYMNDMLAFWAESFIKNGRDEE